MNKEYPDYTDEQVIDGLKNTNRILAKQLLNKERENRWTWFQWFMVGLCFGILIGSVL